MKNYLLITPNTADSIDHAIEELVQVAAVALQAAVSLKRNGK